MVHWRGKKGLESSQVLSAKKSKQKKYLVVTWPGEKAKDLFW